MSIVSDVLLSYLPGDRKLTPSQWLSFNAPCCVHNGESVDTKKRGGLKEDNGVVSFHCFNCGFKTGWQPGRNLSYKMKQFMTWINVPDHVINKLALDILRLNEDSQAHEFIAETPEFHSTRLPDNSVLIDPLTPNNSVHYNKVVDYMSSRMIYPDQDNAFYWSPELNFRERFIIPLTYQNRIVGYTARSIKDRAKPKYLTESQPGYVYGLDQQRPSKVFTVLCEGPIDAQYLEACALMGSEISAQQEILLKQLNKDIIVVPDRDSKGQKLAEQAIELGWQVSMPDWDSDINDIGDAVLRYGRLYTLYSIANSSESSALKIKLKMKKWFKKGNE